MGKGGAKAKFLNDDIRQGFMNNIKMGLPYKTCLNIAGWSESAFYEWKQRAEGTHPKLRDTKKRYSGFMDELKRAEAIAQQKLLVDIQRDSSWVSKAWILERRWPKEFGQKMEVENNMNLRNLFPESIEEPKNESKD